MLSLDLLANLAKIIIAVSIFFVWVVRYDNIISEFNEYGYPNWFRDLLGITKLTMAGILVSSYTELILGCTAIIAVLMAAAVLTHFKVKHAWYKALPSLSLMSLSLIIFFQSL